LLPAGITACAGDAQEFKDCQDRRKHENKLTIPTKPANKQARNLDRTRVPTFHLWISSFEEATNFR
jgi:hypothetical protein